MQMSQGSTEEGCSRDGPSREGRSEEGRSKEKHYFSDISVRARFIRRVFTLVSIMLGVVMFMISIPFMRSSIKIFVQDNLWIYILAYVVYIITYVCLICCRRLRRVFPANIILTVIWSVKTYKIVISFLIFSKSKTLAMGFMMSVICAFHDLPAVLIGVIVTGILSVSVILFSIQTRWDLTGLIGIMFFISLFVMLFGVVACISIWFFGIYWLYLIYVAILAFLFMVFMGIHIQMIVGGRKHEIRPDEYIYAATLLFTDIVGLFSAVMSFN
uniref:Uncharacterized protein n=1 Tax=Ditylenchus dipsaci TaxID=166011 RepID=A0A915D4M3_9BILA